MGGCRGAMRMRTTGTIAPVRRWTKHVLAVVGWESRQGKGPSPR